MSKNNGGPEIVVKGKVEWKPVKTVKIKGVQHELYSCTGCNLYCQAAFRLNEEEPKICLNGNKDIPMAWKNTMSNEVKS